ncbi:MAG TPA: NAD-dependent epimerase/dehydratase family protein, partial [Anaerolineales bacterium]|nr:NAD-dependent epimerase/dehydratase family protein [Anaerolineales bacterium]
MSDNLPSSDFWRSRRVCVTGGTGFLGSYVLEGLRRRGATQVSAPSSSQYDLVQPEQARRLVEDTRPDIVIHLAA